MNAASQDAGGNGDRQHRSEQPVVVVLMPGLDGTDAFLRPVSEQLGTRVRVRLIEFPTDGGNDYPTLLAHVRRSTSDLSSFIVMGFSFSGPLAVMVCEAEPERVRGLVLAATFVRWPRPELRRFHALFRTPTIWMLRLLRRVPGWLTGAGSDQRRSAQMMTWTRVPARTIARRVRAMATVDVSEALRRLHKPVLNVRFLQDRAVPATNAFEIRRCCPHAVAADVAGSHLSLLEDPGVLGEPMLQFIAALESSRRAASAADSDSAT